MPKTQVNCPNCRLPVVAEIEPLFDAGADPKAKQRLLSGSANQIACKNCGYQGDIATIIVYHDPDKELLLTFIPPEIGLAHDEQQRRMGTLINQVVNNLPPEKRKAYLFQPQTMLTYQGLIEKILQADGITKEMIEGQQKRLALIQRFASITDEGVFKEVARQEDALLDAEFFGILARLVQAAEMGGDQAGAEKLAQMQEMLLPETTFGRELIAQRQEIEAAVADLQAAGEGLTREKLLELVLEAPNETRLNALVSLIRPGFDYQFFQLLSDRIERARGEGRNRLIKLREQLLELTQQIDKAVAERQQNANRLIDEILQSQDIDQAMLQALPVVDEFFVQALNNRVQAANESGDQELLSRYQKMVRVIQSASEAPPEIALVEELLSVPDGESQGAAWQEILESNAAMITPEFISFLANLVNQAEGENDPETTRRFKELNRAALRFSMKKNLAGPAI